MNLGSGDPTGHFESVAEITVKYVNQFQEVRQKLTEGEENDDVIVYRFLKGYRFNVQKAADALNRALKFRKQYKTWEIREKARNMKQSEFPYADKVLAVHPHTVLHGFDKMGQPLSLDRMGMADVNLLKKTLTFDQLLQYHLYHMENKAALIAELTAKSGKVVRTAKVMDLSGFSMKLMDVQGLRIFQQVIAISQDNYPELLGNLYVINVPFVFKACWSIVKPMLQPMTLEKIRVFGSSGYQEELRKYIDPETLPEWAGGTCNSCPEGCVIKRAESFGYTEVKVREGDRHALEIDVDSPNATVTWEFRTTRHDIGFRACFVRSGAAPIEVHPLKLVDSHKAPVQGQYEAKEVGRLTLEFDNKHSRWTGKTVLYRYKVLATDILQDPTSPDR